MSVFPQGRPVGELRNLLGMFEEPTTKSPISPPTLRLINDYWSAANYLAAGRIYLRSNPLLRRPLEPSDIKSRPVGHWGTAPGLNLIYALANRLIIEYGLNAIFVAGPGHGAPAIVANCYLEGTYSERYRKITQDEEGLSRFFQQFLFPGGISSHLASASFGVGLAWSMPPRRSPAEEGPASLARRCDSSDNLSTAPLVFPSERYQASFHRHFVPRQQASDHLMPLGGCDLGLS